MAHFEIKDLSFYYPTEKKKPALSHINLKIERGEYVTVCGKSGSGKTTLLRHLKSVLAPHGKTEGEIFFEGKPLKDADLRTYSPLTLAYIGDGVYELVIRTILVKKANCPVNRLHKKASSLVKASAQSGMMETLEPLLTEEEKSVYRRGRNAHSATMAKHATMADYRRATGFEALMGYLYLKEDFSRILELVHAGLEKEEI